MAIFVISIFSEENIKTMALKDTQGYVRSETHKSITTIEFHHPLGNSLTSALLDQLATQIHSAGQNPGTAVIIIRAGEGNAFCGGAAFQELSVLTTLSESSEFFSGFADVINAIRQCPKLTIGRIHGKCVGGGVGIAAAVDYAIALDGADVKLSELSLGFGPFVIAPVLERKIGLTAFSQLAIDAHHWRNADWARRKGLYSELHNELQGFDEAVGRLADHLSHANPAAMLELKKILWHGTDNWATLLSDRAAISGKLAITNFTKAALRNLKLKT
jgi:methylglutaconyl-CoA hydratase